MNLTSPILKGAVHAAELPGDSVTSFLKMVGDHTGLLADDSPDGWLGLLTSGLSGVAAALAVAIILTVYFRSRYRSIRDIARHGLAAALVLGLLAFVAYDMRHAALAYLGINPTKPAVEFEIRLPKAALSDVIDTQVELRTDRNQKLAQLQGALASDDDGRSVLKGSVALDYRTTERFVILTLPGQAQYQFKLRLAASPSHSDQFGPWHLADRMASPNKSQALVTELHDTFAIRYRVI
ncbi:MAG TPA: acriflavin resistance protein [Bradyrhizobium sp.]|nr:acriflavin resistance protein [Bradyrhizobium sp.]